MEMKGTSRHGVARVIMSLVDAFHAPWYGSLAWHVPAGQSVTGIAGE